MDWIYRLESQRREDCWMDERESVVYMGLTVNNVL